MSAIFQINFRREAYQREVARTRARAIQLGLWLLYFGALGVVLGLYALNTATLARRGMEIAHQVARLRRHPATDMEWRPGRPEAHEVERHLVNPRLWRDRLARLPDVLPANARLRSIQFNPDNVSGAADVKLVLVGEMKGASGQERMAQVMSLVGTLSRDSAFSSAYRNVRLVTTRTTSDGDGAEFVLECR